MANIADRVSRIQFLIGNRTDISDRIVEWACDAYLELGMSVPFKELEETFSEAFTVGEGTYTYPDGARSVKAITGFSSAGAPYPLVKRDIRIIRRYQVTTNGRPAIWAPFKDSILVRPLPSTADDFTWDLWMKPDLEETNLEDTELLMPDDWLVIFDHLAAMMGHAALGQATKAQELNILLHGDPKHPDKPGWIKRKLLRDAAEDVVSDFSTDPNVRAYTGR